MKGISQDTECPHYVGKKRLGKIISTVSLCTHIQKCINTDYFELCGGYKLTLNNEKTEYCGFFGLLN